MRKFIIAGNWKMNTNLQEALALANGVKENAASLGSVDRVLIPPFPWIVPVAESVDGTDITVGAQNCYSESAGAFTGEVSPEMLEGHCSHVVIGHSERRHVLGETNELIAAKVPAVLRTSMSAILCVGEMLDERESGSAANVVSSQLEFALQSVTDVDMERVVIAYEPVWAIGTGVAASTDDAQQMAEFVRTWIANRFGEAVAAVTRIQYGGSVKPDNADSLMACPDIDGALVGGASLNASDFGAIIKAAANHSN